MHRAALALALLAAGHALLPALADGAGESRISRFSGKPVPRFESLRHEKVNGRKGPGEDYQVRWEYARKGLPMLIIKESGDWRFVRDPMGDEVWIKQTQLTSQANALTLGAFLLKAGRTDDSADVARVPAGAVVSLESCDEALCQVRVGRYRGWAPRDQLWGASVTNG
jgi:SH3-like domain-containing protein